MAFYQKIFLFIFLLLGINCAEAVIGTSQGFKGLFVPYPYLQSVNLTNISPNVVYKWQASPYALLKSGINNFFQLKRINGIWGVDSATSTISTADLNLLEGGILSPNCPTGQNYQTFTFNAGMRDNFLYQIEILSRSPDTYSDFSLVLNANALIGNIKNILKQPIKKVFEWYVSVTLSGLTLADNKSIMIDKIIFIGEPENCNSPNCMELYTVSGAELLQFQQETGISLISTFASAIEADRSQTAGVKNPPCTTPS